MIAKHYICDFKGCSHRIDPKSKHEDIRAVRIARMNPWQGYYIFHACGLCFQSLEKHLDKILDKETKEGAC